MATYIITVADPEPGEPQLPDAHAVLCDFALTAFSENVTGHCMYAHRDHMTGDDVSAHFRLGLTVRKLR